MIEGTIDKNGNIAVRARFDSWKHVAEFFRNMEPPSSLHPVGVLARGRGINQGRRVYVTVTLQPYRPLSAPIEELVEGAAKWLEAEVIRNLETWPREGVST